MSPPAVATSSSPFSSVTRRLVASGILVVLLLNALTLGIVPAGIEDDDGAYASAAYTFWRTGGPGVPGYHDVVDLETDVWAFGRISAAVQGSVMAFAGVSLRHAMLPTFLAGVALVVCTGGFARAIAGTDSALLAMLMLALSGKFFLATHGMRPDTLFAAFLLGSLWIVAARGGTSPIGALFTAGLVTGISSDVHVNGFFLAPIPGLFWLASTSSTRTVRVKALAANVGGLCIGFTLWAVLHYLPNPERFHDQLPVMGGSTHGFRLLRYGVTGAFLKECQRYVDWFWLSRGHRHVPEALCVFAGATWVAARASRKVRASLVAWIGIFILSTAFLSNNFGWYLIYVWPLFCIWMAAAFVAYHRSWMARFLLVALVTVHLGDLSLWSYKSFKDVPYEIQAARLRSDIPPDAPVLASGCWWFAFWDRDFTDVAYMEFRETEASQKPEDLRSLWEDERRRRGWKYVVASNRLLRILDPDVTDTEAASGPRTDFAHVAAARGFIHDNTAGHTRLPGVQNATIVFELTDADSRR